MKNKVKFTASCMMVISLIAILVLSFVAEALQTDGWKVEVQELQIQTARGYHISADLYLPEGVSTSNPLPLVISIHGRRKSKEEYESVAIELSRRGVIVLNYDMYGHVDSTDFDSRTDADGNKTVDNGMDALDIMKYVSTLEFVDQNKIGVTGQSSGAKHAFDWSYDQVLAAGMKYAALMFVGSDPTYKNGDGEYYNKYGSVPVGIVAASCDDWYYMNKTDYLNWGNFPRDWVSNNDAKSFFTWGGDPSTFGAASVVPGQYYTKTIDGVETFRVVWTPTEVHSYNMLSPASTKSTIEFFVKALDINTSIPNSSLHFYAREWCLRFCVLFFFMFVASFAVVISKTKYFSELSVETDVLPSPTPARAGKIWWWSGIILTAIFGALLLVPATEFGMTNASAAFPTDMTMALGFWGALVGIFSLLLCLGNYIFYGKKAGFSLRDRGVTISFKKLLKTILLSLIVILGAYTVIAAADFFFNVNFRIWSYNISLPNTERIGYALRYLPLFLITFIASSVSINSFRYNGIGGKTKWGNIAILTLFNVIGVLVWLGLQYGHFFIAGDPMWHASRYAQTAGTANYGTPITLIAAPLVTRFIYKKTNNPYLGGIIMAIIATLISVASSVASYSR